MKNNNNLDLEVVRDSKSQWAEMIINLLILVNHDGWRMGYRWHDVITSVHLFRETVNEFATELQNCWWSVRNCKTFFSLWYWNREVVIHIHILYHRNRQRQVNLTSDTDYARTASRFVKEDKTDCKHERSMFKLIKIRQIKCEYPWPGEVYTVIIVFKIHRYWTNLSSD